MKIIPKQIDEAVLAVLSACEVMTHKSGGAAVFIRSGNLDRKVYERVNEVLAVIGGKWNRSAKAHLYGESADDVLAKLDDVILAEEIAPPSRNGFFPTPPELAARMVEVAEIRPGNRVLEPSAGTGNILAAIPGNTVRWAVEINPTLARATNLHQMAKVVCGDFLEQNGNLGQFDRIVMNPPFERLGDIKHVLHAYDMLAPGGRLVSVMSPGVKFRREAPAVRLRELIESRNGTIEDLPANSFASVGTNVNTILLTLHRAA